MLAAALVVAAGVAGMECAAPDAIAGADGGGEMLAALGFPIDAGAAVAAAAFVPGAASGALRGGVGLLASGGVVSKSSRGRGASSNSNGAGTAFGSLAGNCDCGVLAAAVAAETDRGAVGAAALATLTGAATDAAEDAEVALAVGAIRAGELDEIDEFAVFAALLADDTVGGLSADVAVDGAAGVAAVTRFAVVGLGCVGWGEEAAAGCAGEGSVGVNETGGVGETVGGEVAVGSEGTTDDEEAAAGVDRSAGAAS